MRPVLVSGLVKAAISRLDPLDQQFLLEKRNGCHGILLPFCQTLPDISFGHFCCLYAVIPGLQISVQIIVIVGSRPLQGVGILLHSHGNPQNIRSTGTIFPVKLSFRHVTESRFPQQHDCQHHAERRQSLPFFTAKQHQDLHDDHGDPYHQQYISGRIRQSHEQCDGTPQQSLLPHLSLRPVGHQVTPDGTQDAAGSDTLTIDKQSIAIHRQEQKLRHKIQQFRCPASRQFPHDPKSNIQRDASADRLYLLDHEPFRGACHTED